MKYWQMPWRFTDWVEFARPLLSSVMSKVRGSAPPWAGAKTTLIVQELPAARLRPQLLVWVNMPLMAMLAMRRGALPVLPSVTGWEALDVPAH